MNFHSLYFWIFSELLQAMNSRKLFWRDKDATIAVYLVTANASKNNQCQYAIGNQHKSVYDSVSRPCA
jgi:hypothetical protein